MPKWQLARADIVGCSICRKLRPMSANQENISPVPNPVTNFFRNAAHDALASHIDRSVVKSKKRRSRDQKSNAEKIESLFGSMDRGCTELSKKIK